MQKNDLLLVAVTAISFAGLGIAKYSDEKYDNFIIFIHNAIPGDTVLCKIVKIEKRFAYAIIDKIIEPSKSRKDPCCPTFDKCGGCVFMNMDYETELAIKKDFVKDALRRHLQGFPEPQGVFPSPVIENYRNKTVCPLSQNGKFGFYARASHRNIENNSCNLQDISFSPVLKAAEDYISKMKIIPYNEQTGKGLFRQLYIRKAITTGEIFACAVINGEKLPNEKLFADEMEKCGVKSVAININKTRGNTVLGEKFRIIRGEEYIEDILCNLHFKISPQSFYQINSRQAELLYTHAITLASPKKDDILLDLYCGIGTISLIAAEHVAEVIGIETVPEAVLSAKENAAINKIKNAKFFATPSANTLEILKKENINPNIIIVDPPRKGLDAMTIDAIFEIAAERLVYISCNPETLARDLNILTSSENTQNPYKIENISAFDMFPRTPHVECVCLLTRDIFTDGF